MKSPDRRTSNRTTAAACSLLGLLAAVGLLQVVVSAPVMISRHLPPLNVTAYLLEFGYLEKAQGDLNEALLQFQRFAQIPVTGVVDQATISKMRARRCGNRDFESEKDNGESQFGETWPKGRRKRYAIEGSYWGVKNITYSITKFTTEMSKPEVRNVLRRAFKVWEEHSPLRFVYKDNGQANIDILFARRSHGDGEPFDGRGQILAHAFFPRYGGDVHFDDEEPWRVLQTRGNGIDLYSVAAHEIGHSLGLKHSQNHDALMAPFYQSYTGNAIHLHQDDISALRHLYGKMNLNGGGGHELGKFKPEKTGFHEDPEEESVRDIPPDICDEPSLDAITVLGNGTTYAFKGEYYWRLNEFSFDEGWPRKIVDDWFGLQPHLDAAVTDSDGDTYFFKGHLYWLYDRLGRMYEGYPKKIAVGLVDTPPSIDAALIWSYDDKPYFFKNEKYWQYSRWGMPRGWPRPIKQLFRAQSTLKIPTKIDAAVTWTNGRSYLFAGRQYFRLTSWRTMKVAAELPRDIGEWWFGCNRGRRRTIRSHFDYSDK